MSNTTIENGENLPRERKGRSGNLTYKRRNIVSAIWPPERIELVKQLHPTMSHKQIAEALGTTRGSIDSIVTRLKLRKPKPVKRVYEGNRCRAGCCTDSIQAESWPWCPDHMKAARKKHHV